MVTGFKMIAVLRAIRGLIAFTLGACLLYLAFHLDGFSSEGHPIINTLAQKDSVFELIIYWLANFTKYQIIGLALLAFLFALIRAVEAIGVWCDHGWAKWLALLMGIIYIPLEVNELFWRYSLGMSIVLIVNILVVAYLFWKLCKSSKTRS